MAELGAPGPLTPSSENPFAPAPTIPSGIVDAGFGQPLDLSSPPSPLIQAPAANDPIVQAVDAATPVVAPSDAPASTGDPIIDALNAYEAEQAAGTPPPSLTPPSPPSWLAQHADDAWQNLRSAFDPATWEGMWQSAKGSAESAAGGLGEMVGNALPTIQEHLTTTLGPKAGAIATQLVGNMYDGLLERLEKLRKPSAQLSDQGTSTQQQAAQQAKTWLSRQMIGAAGMAAPLGASLAAGILGGPEAGAGVFGATGAGQAYSEARQASDAATKAGQVPIGQDDRYAYAAQEGLINLLMQELPLGEVLKRGAPLIKRLVNSLGAAIPANVAMTVAGQLAAQHAGVRKPQTAAQWRQTIGDTIGQTILSMGPMALLGHAATHEPLIPTAAPEGVQPSDFETDLRRGAATLRQAASAADTAQAQAQNTAASMPDAQMQAHPRYQTLLANAQGAGMQGQAAADYARQSFIAEQGAQAATDATVHAAAAIATAPTPTGTLGDLLKQARAAGIAPERLRDVTQGIIRKELTPEQGITHLQAALNEAAATPATPTVVPEETAHASNPTNAVGSEGEPAIAGHATGNGRPGSAISQPPAAAERPNGQFPAEEAPANPGAEPSVVPSPQAAAFTQELEQARGETETQPTEAQKDAGNYKKGTLDFGGMTIAIENPKGSVRTGTNADGTPWRQTMAHDYGYVKGTRGADREGIDVFLTGKPDTGRVYVVNQVDPETGRFDEHKAVLGASSREEAEQVYRANYPAGWKGMSSVEEMPTAQFREKAEGGEFRNAAPAESVPVPAPAAPEPPAPTPQVAPEAAATPVAPVEPPEAMPAPRARRVRPSAKQLAEARLAKRREHYTPGNIVEGYGGIPDRVLDYRENPDKTWQVKVQEVKRNAGGEWEPNGEPRWHQTEPGNARILERAPQETSPVERGEGAPSSGEAADERALAAFHQRLSAEGYRSITEARGDYQRVTGERVTPANQKHVDELLERAVVEHARATVAQGHDPESTYHELTQLYDRQPRLATRTSTSVANQAYSTPAPLAYLASHLAGIGPDTTVYEPSAGNGMLLIGADPAHTRANELDPQRAAVLKAHGFTPTVGDALDPANQPAPESEDAVIANPPFGAVRGENGTSRMFSIRWPDGNTLNTTNVDFAIAAKALEAMKSDGHAVLLVGSVAKTAEGRQARSDAYSGAARRKFFWNLFNNYHISDMFTVGGNLYEKQGAGWPVDVIVINGRGKSDRPLPAVEPPPVYTSWTALAPKLEESRVERGPTAETGRLGAEGGRPADAALGGPRAAGNRDELGHLPELSRGSDSGAGERLPGPEGSGDGAHEGPVGSGPVSGVGAGEPEARGTGSDRGQRGDRAPFAELGTAGETAAVGTGAGEGVAGSAGSDQRGSVRPSHTPEGVGRISQQPPVTDTEADQVPYQPASTARSVGTLVPAAIQTAVRDSLETLQQRVGPLNDYVARELGYEPDELGQRFSAEQIDALGLALDQMGRDAGFIIGDQTGVGKGRFVAGVIRYAIRKGLTPIFVTEKPNLYADMYRDLTDIGQEDIRPLMTNAAEKVPLDPDGNLMLRTPAAARHNADLMRMAAEGNLGDHNIVFTTYSQMQTLKGELTARQRFLQALAPNAIVILDESHNAGGTDAGRASRARGIEAGDKIGRAGFARSLISAARGAVYSSATYAKRPSVMDLYFKTDMAKAVEGDVKKLPEAIAAGGVPLQQAVAAMLTKAGQYIRRERTFKGVEYNTPVVNVDRNAAEDISRVMLAVKEFDDLKADAVEALEEDVKRNAASVSSDGSIGKAGVDSVNFTSIMHNLIDQMLLALKADAAADRAVEALKNGEKPVITLANTMGSFIEHYADAAKLKGGDTVGLTFRDLMRRYLDRSRTITIKGPNGDKKTHVLTDAELGPVAVGKYRETLGLIKRSDFGDVPVSPIDWIHHRLRQAGHTSGEITGRSATLDYDNPGGATLRMRPERETSPAARNRTITDFNNGKLDALVFNAAGSTGISLHASEKFKDQRRRRMILAQPERNIDTHMQMLGRVHRTGQVTPPVYDQLVADVPAEKRPAAVLAKKMASLNANTTGSRGSQLTAKESVDFLNEYGDEVVAQLMEDMPEIHAKLGRPLTSLEDGLDPEEAARRVTGRIPLLPVAEQERLYEAIEGAYKERLARADALGENALEAKTLPLEAQRLKRTELFSGTRGDTSPFSAGAWADTMKVKRIGKPFTSAEVRDQVAKRLSGQPEADMQQLAERGEIQQRETIAKTQEEFQAYRAQQEERMLAGDMSDPAQQARLRMLDGQELRWRHAMRNLHVGGQYELTVPNSGVLYGVVTEIRRRKNTEMPVATGAWSAHFAVADGARTVTIPFSRMDFAGQKGSEKLVRVRPATRNTLTGEPVMNMFDSGQSTSTEERVIVNGNLLAGYSRVGKGQIIAYTTQEGRLEQGILLPRSFDLDQWSEAQPVELSGDQLEPFFDEAKQGIVKSADGNLTIRRWNDGYVIQVPKSKAQGGKYFLDRGLTDITGDFSSGGNWMRAQVDARTLARAAQYIERHMDEPLRTETFKDEAIRAGGRSLAGKPEGGVAARTEVREDQAQYEPPQAAQNPERPTGVDTGGRAASGETVRVGRGSPDLRTAEPIQVYENHGRPIPARTAARILSRVAHVQTGRFSTSLDHISSWQDAAHLIAPLRHSAQEQVVAIALDKENRPIGVLRHSLGSVNSSPLHPGLVAGAVLRMPKVESVYLAHNHPSGSLMPSEADETVTQHVAGLLKGTRVSLKGMLIVAPGRTHATFFEPGQFMQSGEMTLASRRGNSVPQLERRLTAIRPTERSMRMTKVLDQIDTIERSKLPAGALMMDAQGQDLGTIVIPEEGMRGMGLGGAHQEKLLTSLERANAVTAIPFGSQAGAAQVAQFLHEGGYHVPYALGRGTRDWTLAWKPPKEKSRSVSEAVAEEPPEFSASDLASSREADRAYRAGDDAALGNALEAMSMAQRPTDALPAPVREILAKPTVESADRPAMEDATARLLVGEPPESPAGGSGTPPSPPGPPGPPGAPGAPSEPTRPFRGAAPEDPEITAIRRKVMANAKYEGLPLKQRLRLLFSRWTGLSGLAVRQGIADSFASIAEYEKLLNDGKLLDAAVSPYKQTIATQNMPSVMTAIMKTGIPVYQDGAYVRAADGRKGILEIFAPLVNHPDGNLLPQWELYAAARRAARLLTEKNADGTSREKLFSQSDVDRALQLVDQYPVFNQVFNDWQDFNRQTLDMAEEAGLIDPQGRAIWESNDYVPFYRAMDAAAGTVNPTALRKAISNQSSRIRRLTGRPQQLEDVFESMLMNTAHLVDASFKNRAAQYIVTMFDGVATSRHPLDREGVDIDVPQVRRALEAAGINLSESLTPEQKKTWLTFFHAVKPAGDNIVTVRFEGKPQYYEVHDPLLYQSITQMNPDGVERLLRQLGFTAAKRFTTRMATAMPAFLVRNFVRDTTEAWAQNHIGLTPLVSAFRGLGTAVKDDLSGRNGIVHDLMLAGAGGDAIYDSQPGSIKKILMRRMGRYGESGAEKVIRSVVSPRRAWEAYTAIQQASENANRIAVYKAARRTGASHAEAAYQAHDLLNFQQRGAWGGVRLATGILPFLNARIQGFDRLMRSYTENRGAFLLKGAMLAGLTAATMVLGANNPQYEQLEDWDRDTYWHFFVGKAHFRIPKPFELGTIFGTLPERAIRKVDGSDTWRDTGESLVRALADTFALNPIPPAALPVLEDVTNYDFFTGRNVVPESLQDKLPELQSQPWTSPTLTAWARHAPQWLPDWARSPVRLQHLIRGYTDAIGITALTLADRLTRSAGGYPDAPSKPWYEQWIPATPVTTSAPRNTKWTDELYRMQAEADASARAVTQYVREGQIQQARKEAAIHHQELLLRPALDGLVKRMHVANIRARAIMRSRLSADQKRVMLEKLNEQRNALARRIAPYAGAF